MNNKIDIIEEILNKYNCNNFESTKVLLNNFIDKIFDFIKTNTDLDDTIIIKSITYYFIKIANDLKGDMFIYYCILLNDNKMKEKKLNIIDDIEYFRNQIDKKIILNNNLELIYYYIDYMIYNYKKGYKNNKI